MKKKLLAVLVITLVSVFALTACGGEDADNGEAEEQNGNDVGEMQPEELDMDDFEADDVFLRVNGQDILFSEFEEEFERSKDMAAMQYGIDFDDEESAVIIPQLQQQAIESLISQNVLIQEARDEGIEVSEEEVDQSIEDLTLQFGGEEGLEQAMEAEGMDDESLRAFLYDNLMIEQLLNRNIDMGNIEVTDEEVEAFYAQLEESWEQQGQESTPLEEIEARIIEQLEQQKMQEKQMEYLETLIGDSEIERFYQ